MKCSYAVLILFLLSSIANGQLEKDIYIRARQQADSLNKAKDYKNAALAYSSLVNNGHVTNHKDDRFSAAENWALSKYPDSAFVHLLALGSDSSLRFYDITSMLTNTNLSSLHTDNRWVEIKKLFFQTGYATFLREYERTKGIVSLPDRYEAAGAWTLKGNHDSAFSQLNFIAHAKGNTYTHFNRIHTSDILIPLHKDPRWQPLMDSLYRNVATTYSTRYRQRTWSTPTLDAYNAAVAWSFANNADSVFHFLNQIINTDINVYSNFNALKNEKAFRQLYNDARWVALMEKTRKSYVPLSCGHSKGLQVSTIPMSFTIDSNSVYLKSDGKGTYIHGKDRVSSRQIHAYNFSCSGWDPFHQSYNRSILSPRWISFDLTQPINNSGAVSQGIIKDNDAGLHVFGEIDMTKTPWMIDDFRQIPIGSSIEVPRFQMELHIDGVLHIFQMGPWAQGQCNEWYAYNGKINGEGTTKVKAYRTSETSYTVESPQGSIGRLWNMHNMTKPVDKGLYKTSFIFHVKTL